MLFDSAEQATISILHKVLNGVPLWMNKLEMKFIHSLCETYEVAKVVPPVSTSNIIASMSMPSSED